MHRTLCLPLIFLVLLVACGPASQALSTPRPAAPSTALAVPSPAAAAKTIESVAHRGGAGLAAENTLAAFRIAMNFRPDFVQVDVHLTKDGIPIVMHDPTIDRTTEGRGRLADMTLAELGRFSTHASTQSYREPIPTLAQVLDLAKSRYTQVQVEIRADAEGKRYPGIEEKVLDELTAQEMVDRARILSLDMDTLKRFRAICPNARTVALLSADNIARVAKPEPGAIVDGVASYANGIGVEKGFLSRELIEAGHRRGLSVGVWVVDQEVEMDQLARMGVDSIITNRLDRFNKVFGR